MDNEEEEGPTCCLFKKDIAVQTVIYFTQVIIIYIVIVWCLINISLDRGDCGVWTNLLSSCLGYLLPSPTLKLKKHYHI